MHLITFKQNSRLIMSLPTTITQTYLSYRQAEVICLNLGLRLALKHWKSHDQPWAHLTILGMYSWGHQVTYWRLRCSCLRTVTVTIKSQIYLTRIPKMTLLTITKVQLEIPRLQNTTHRKYSVRKEEFFQWNYWLYERRSFIYKHMGCFMLQV